jgi:hypothetical protein
MKWSELISDWKELFNLSFDDNWHLSLQVSPLLICLASVSVVIICLLRLKGGKLWHRYDIVEGEIPIAGLGKVKIKPNNETINIAYRAWTELITRKVALPYEEDHDVIVEVYNSWYSVFGILRELAKNIPAHKLRHDKNTKKLVEVMIAVLNEGLRPHLTRWQARFRQWYKREKEAESNASLSPQEIQKKFPEYTTLITDIQSVNKIMLKYAEWLQKIVEGEK